MSRGADRNQECQKDKQAKFHDWLEGVRVRFVHFEAETSEPFSFRMGEQHDNSVIDSGG